MKKAILGLALLVSSCARHLDEIHSAAPLYFAKNHLQIVAYEGYQWSIFGACDWYIVKQIPDNGILYNTFLIMWRGELFMYEFKAIDAIKPKN